MTVAILVAGTSSGVGKTSVALGLMRALTRRGLKVQPFKVGPDYLDPIWHQVAAGRTSYNLDAWMTSPEYVRQLFANKSADADVAIVEGVMGLFDGASPTSLSGSTGEIASLLNVPVLLVANAHGTSRSFAAMVKGYAEFEESCQVTHVIANQCGSDRHAQLLDESLTAAVNISLAGYIKRENLPKLPSRHLGLSTPVDRSDADKTCNGLADEISQACDIDSLLLDERLITRIQPDSCQIQLKTLPFASPGSTLAVARDEAFFFYYPDNLELLEAGGVNIVYFSPTHDQSL
ncbi:MAG: cobyrinate a,c-diamide synthase, partial [Pirellulales bacterium]|nr:cobyrinate a,c-diamide synthase [Pirellulales bacterium]